MDDIVSAIEVLEEGAAAVGAAIDRGVAVPAARRAAEEHAPGAVAASSAGA